VTIHLLVAQTVRPLKRVIGKPANAGGCAYKTHAREQLGVFSAELARGNVDYDFCIGGLNLVLGATIAAERSTVIGSAMPAKSRLATTAAIVRHMK
jgi:hypothetical protein